MAFSAMILLLMNACIVNISIQLIIHTMSGASGGRAAGIALQTGSIADHLAASALITDVPGEPPLACRLSRTTLGILLL